MTSRLRPLDGARVLVTGGSGLIGRAVTSAFLDRGSDVVVFDRTAPGTVGCDWIEADICDPVAVADAVAGIDVLVHLAGIPGLGQENALTTYRINTIGSFTVMLAAVEARVPKVVYASSINAAGWPLNPTPTLPPSYPFDEDSAPAIGDWYSLSKVANEDAAAMLASRFPTSFTGLRYPLVRDIVADPARFRTHLIELTRDDPSRAASEGWSYLDAWDAGQATVAAAIHHTPAAPGILVAAPRTFLTNPTDEALALAAPRVARGAIEGRDVPIDLSRARDLLEFQARVLLDDIAPEALVTLAKEAFGHA